MRSKGGFGDPVVRFHVEDGIVGANVGLVEDEGLLFGGGAFVFGLFE